MSTELVERTTVEAIVKSRDAAIETMREAADLMAKARELAMSALKMGEQAYGSATFYEENRQKSAAYDRLFADIDPETSMTAFTHKVDARTWQALVTLTGMNDLMDRTEKDKFRADLASNDLPPVTVDNIYNTLKKLGEDRVLIFRRGLARVFADLDRRFKSHDAFKIGSRIIITHVFDQWGSWNWGSSSRDTVADIERVFGVLDGKRPQIGTLAAAIDESRGRGSNPRQSTTISDYFRVKGFKNGNAHFWFTRDDLVDLANLELAKYYGAVLPDAVPREPPPEDLFRSQTGELSKDLAFYPTPKAVTKQIIKSLCINKTSVVLEPSAGTGHMVDVLLATGARVHAMEVDRGRWETLCEWLALMDADTQRRVGTIQNSNFLQCVPVPKYTHVVMNPPFYGTHWMQHIYHAFKFLQPGGTLVAVLPISADLGTSKKHIAFRKWAKDHTTWGKLRFADLPAESFATSGTRINTVYLTLHADRERS